MTWALRATPQPFSSIPLTLSDLAHEFATDSEDRLAEAQQALLERAKVLVSERIYPRAPLAPYLTALRPVLHFIKTHEKRFTEAHISSDFCAVLEGMALELQSLPHVPLQTLPPEPHSLQDVAATAAMLLRAYQDAVRRVAHGSHHMSVRAAFGLSESIQSNRVDQVVEAIDLFLMGARRYPAFLQEAGLSPGQLRGLRVQQKVLQAWLAHSQGSTIPSLQSLEQARLLHAVVEYFFDRFAAVVGARFLDLPEERLRGLQLVPRTPREQRNRRHMSVV